ncbi:MAG TPA: hypothetical protein ENK19_00545 [Acidobacteria bacterium]|nr:hypothetical protein [Acidobacteriota bacterium]
MRNDFMSGFRNVMLPALALALVMLPSPGTATAQEAQAAPPGGQLHLSIPGTFVRVVYNDEGYVVLGYATANASVGQEWMLLEIGLTTQQKVQATVHRDGIAVITPDGQTVPLATQQEYNAAGGKLRSLNARANIQRQSINYFPAWSKNPCRVGFFSDTSQNARMMTYDQISLDWRRACVGRLYFHLPEKIQYGQYYLQVKFPHSTIKVPFRIMTKEELKKAKAKLKEMQKEAKAKAKADKKK